MLTPWSLNVKLYPRRNYHKGQAAIRHYANQPNRPLWLLRLRPNFTTTYRGVNVCLALCLNSVLNVKALVGANQEKALVGAFSVIVKTDCETDWSFASLVWIFARELQVSVNGGDEAVV